LIKDVGAVAIGDGKWEIYIGGAGGSHVRKGDLLCIVDSEDDVLLYTARFIQFYRENAKFKERTYTFVERLGIERVRAVVVDDSDGLAVQLDTAMQESVAAAWREAIAPKTANQFNSIVEAEGT
jgi:nitrite reductase (NADH) large subunit